MCEDDEHTNQLAVTFFGLVKGEYREIRRASEETSGQSNQGRDFVSESPPDRPSLQRPEIDGLCCPIHELDPLLLVLAFI